MGTFKLRKWYFDVIDYKGSAYIGYWVNLKYKGLNISGTQDFWTTKSSGKHTKLQLRNTNEPTIQENQIQWETNLAKGKWSEIDKSINHELMKTDTGNISWNCVYPKSKAQLKIKGENINGYGYVEVIDITIPFWNLQFEKLYWGRAHSKNHTLIWIKWIGKKEDSFLWHNGKLYKEAYIENDKIGINNISCVLNRDIVLKDGSVESQLNSSFSKVLKYFPLKSLAMNETKWYGNGHIIIDGKKEEATMLFEEVIWN